MSVRTGTAPRIRAARTYTLKVWVVSGPKLKKAGKTKALLQISGRASLADLHRAIFREFERVAERLYEFNLGRHPSDPQGPHYNEVPTDSTGAFPAGVPAAADARSVTLAELGLRQGLSFWYWFDFGDDWIHRIDVVSTPTKTP